MVDSRSSILVILLVLLCTIGGVLLMGCTIEDLTGGDGEEKDNGDGEGNGDGNGGDGGDADVVNIVLLDLSAELTNGVVELTFAIKSEGQLGSSIDMGVRVTKGAEESWVEEFTLDADSMNKLNAGQTIFESASFDLPDWGSGEYIVKLVADKPDEVDEDDETDNDQETTVMKEHNPPLAPSSVAKTGTLPCSISWVDNSDNEDGFNIYLGHSCGGVELVKSWTLTVTVGPDVTSYSWSQSCCSVAECSWVMIRAFNDDGESVDSNTVMLAPLC